MIVRSQTTHKKEVGSMNISEYEINEQYSGALITLKGDHGELKNTHENRFYFILEGSGYFVLDGKEQSVKKHDLVFVPKNTFYNIGGEMTYFMMCSPKFNSEHDIFK